jgi:hypothetical protein
MFAIASSKGRTARSFGGLRMTKTPTKLCHPMFAIASSKGRTARSFGGLRMTKTHTKRCHPMFANDPQIV